jgi:predicted dehydrogenase
LVAICDRDEKLSRNVAAKFKVSRYYTDFNRMLDCEKLDVVNICTPINTHAPLAIQAMEAGCHVLTEKPMAISVEESNKMVEVAKKCKVKLSVNHQLLFVPTIQKMKSLINKGVIGELVRMEIVQSTPPRDYPPIADPSHWYHKLPGGIHGDNLPHPIYLMREFLGNINPIAVYSNKMGNIDHLQIDEVQIIMKGERGNGTIISSCNYPSLWLINIFGTKKCLYCDLNNSYVVTYEGRSIAGQGIPLLYGLQNINRSFQILNSTLSMAIKFMSGKHRGLPISIARFIESVQSDKQSPVTAEDGREVVRIWEKITSQI